MRSVLDVNSCPLFVSFFVCTYYAHPSQQPRALRLGT